MYLENLCSSLSGQTTKLQINAPHLISQASCEARWCGRLHIAHLILTTGSWDEALREMDEEPVVIVFCVCSWANMEHVAAVREPGGLQRPVQSCQIGFRLLTACGSGRKAWWKWNHSVCAEREGSADHWPRIWNRSGELSYLIHAHAHVHLTHGSRNVFNPNLFVSNTRQTPKPVV